MIYSMARFKLNILLLLEMAKIAGEELSAIFGSELELSEIGYLALYFEMILRKQNSVVNGSRKQIAVVCTTGRELLR